MNPVERARQQRRGGFGRRVGLSLLTGAGALALAGGIAVGTAQTPEATPVAGLPAPSADLEITAAGVRHLQDLDLLVFEQTVAGTAGATMPVPAGQLDGAPVVAYVFPMTLAPAAVGFGDGDGDGILALVAAVHPDFDDTPLWDENLDGIYDNDGGLYHAHWAVLVPDDRAPGGLAVKDVAEADAAALPPTSAGLPLALDSPGFPVLLDGANLRVVVPTGRVGDETDFRFDAVASGLTVNTSDPNRPLLGVDQVYFVLSGDLSLPATVTPE